MCADNKAAKESMQQLVQKFLAEIIGYLQKHWSVSAKRESETWSWSTRSSPVDAAQSLSTSKTHHSPSDPSTPSSSIRFPLPCQNAAIHQRFSHLSLCYNFNQRRQSRSSIWRNPNLVSLCSLSRLIQSPSKPKFYYYFLNTFWILAYKFWNDISGKLTLHINPVLEQLFI